MTTGTEETLSRQSDKLHLDPSLSHVDMTACVFMRFTTLITATAALTLSSFMLQPCNSLFPCNRVHFWRLNSALKGP